MPDHTKMPPSQLDMSRSISGDHVMNEGPTYLWTVKFAIEDRVEHNYIVLADTSEEAIENAFKYVHSEYSNSVVIRISAYREKRLVLPAN